MSQIKNSRILITGAASGIGLLMAEKCLNQGCSALVLWDRDSQTLKKVAEKLSSSTTNTAKIIAQEVDVSNLQLIQAAFEHIEQSIGGIDILINNAGIIIGKYFWEHTHAEIDRTMDINSAALMHIARVVLNQMILQNKGHIVNIASAAGLVANPKMSVYCGSKWAVVGWSDSLRLELEEKYPNIKVTTVLPYYISTGMFDGVQSWFIPILKPDDVASKILKAIQKDSIFLQMPFLINFVTLIKGLLPARVFDLVVGKFLGIYKSMENFKGHKSK